MDNDPFLRVRDHRNVYLRQVDIFIRYPAKRLCRHACQLRQRFVAVDDRFHQIGGVIFIAKGMQGIQHRAVRFIAQRLQVTTGKTRSRVRRVNGFCTHLRHAHPVSRTGKGQFSINGIALAVSVFFIQQGSRDRIRQTIHCTSQRIILNFEIEGCTVRRRAGVVAAAMHFEKFGQAIWLWVFFGTHKRHMFQIVCKPRVGFRIFQRPNRHHQCRQGFYRLRIGNQQHSHPVIKANSLILTGIFFALTDSFLNGLPTGVCVSDGRPKGNKQNKRFKQGAAWHYDLFITATSLTNCVLDSPTSLSLGTSVRDKKCIINEHPILRNFYTALRTD